MIEISSYTDNEKVHIAVEHLIPKQLKKHGIKPEQLHYQQRSCRKDCQKLYQKKQVCVSWSVRSETICQESQPVRSWKSKKKPNPCDRDVTCIQYLGKEKYQYQMANETDEDWILSVGLHGPVLAGITLQIEVNVMPGEGEITADRYNWGM